VSVRRITVLISGKGSNLQALIDACDSGQLSADLVHVISDRADAAGLERASGAGVPTSILEAGGFTGRGPYDQALANLVAEHSPDLVILAGFMRILGPATVQRFGSRMINLHPSLLPLYRGTDTYRRAIEARDKEHGSSMHFVTAELDGGPVISQVRIPIVDNDTPVSLAARLAPREHDLVVATAELFCRCPVQCMHGTVTVDGDALQRPLQLRDDGTFET
jgi:phosphoribosylglycinamide formyltransferase 1